MKKKKLVSRTTVARRASALHAELLTDVRALIEQSRDAAARSVNTALVLLYWSVGDRVRREILKETRAEYGKQIVGALSQKLAAEYGKGFTADNLFRMIQFAETFPNHEIVGALSRQLGWSHFVLLLPLKDELKRGFYAEMCRVERWSVRTLRQKIGGMLFERTALSRKPTNLVERELTQLREADRISPDLVFRDPYFLDFLGLKDAYSEKDLEAAILRELEAFILELGAGFTFVARQKRMVIDGEDFSLDLLFFHRKLRRLIAIDLKLEKFQAADKGQMELYLRWLDKHEREPWEESPLGLILCESAGGEQVELLQLGASGNSECKMQIAKCKLQNGAGAEGGAALYDPEGIIPARGHSPGRGPRYRNAAARVALKGRHSIAQGATLGIAPATRAVALKGRHSQDVASVLRPHPPRRNGAFFAAVCIVAPWTHSRWFREWRPCGAYDDLGSDHPGCSAAEPWAVEYDAFGVGGLRPPIHLATPAPFDCVASRRGTLASPVGTVEFSRGRKPTEYERRRSAQPRSGDRPCSAPPLSPLRGLPGPPLPPALARNPGFHPGLSNDARTGLRRPSALSIVPVTGTISKAGGKHRQPAKAGWPLPRGNTAVSAVRPRRQVFNRVCGEVLV